MPHDLNLNNFWRSLIFQLVLQHLSGKLFGLQWLPGAGPAAAVKNCISGRTEPRAGLRGSTWQQKSRGSPRCGLST